VSYPSDNLLVVAPKFDDVTEYSLAWCVKARNEIFPYIALIDHLDEDAVWEKVEKNLDRAAWFMHYDHGSEYVMWGDDEKPLIDLSRLGRLAGKRVYTMNCSSGKGLGAHAVEKGVLEYWGYNDVVSFTTDALEEFGEAFNYGIVHAIIGDLSLKDVVEEARENGYKIADKLQAEGKILAASCLVRDMNILHVYYEGGPPPPPPECRVSRMIKNLFGWNGLHFFRMIRQKLFPETLPRAAEFSFFILLYVLLSVIL